MLSYKRSVRVAEQIQKEVSKIVQELREPELGFVTITDVSLTDDLQDARIYYSVLGSEEEIQKSKKVIQSSAQEIRHQLATSLNLRRTPTLNFIFDETPKKATQIFELLEKIKKEDNKDKEK